MIRWHNKKRVYVCNWAVGITKGKYTNDPKKVTCKNCKKKILRLLMKVVYIGKLKKNLNKKSKEKN